MAVIAPRVAKPSGYRALSVVILLGRSWNVTFSVDGVVNQFAGLSLWMSTVLVTPESLR